MKRTRSRWLHGSFILLACAICATAARPALAAPESFASSFNLYSVEQDVEIGRQSATEVEAKVPLLNDAAVDRYLNRIVQVLAAQTPGASYPYRIKAVNDPTINAFALPGGPLYANRGLLVAARSEAELAGVIAHEIAHVALRHGTHQASKASLASAGLGILGGLLGDSGSDAAQMINVVGGLGLNAAFLKFSRDAEYEADRLGAEIMAASGYDPTAMADFFALLRAEGARNPGALATFFSSHPPSAEREARIRTQANTLVRRPSRAVGGFEAMVAGLERLPSSSPAALAVAPAATAAVSSGPPLAVRVAAPSARYKTFEHRGGYFKIDYPANWKAYGSGKEYATSLAPDGGIVEAANDQPALVYGVVVNHYAPFEGERVRREVDKRGKLENASLDLVRQIRRSNPHLRPIKGSTKQETIAGTPARSVILAGRSPVTGKDERVVVSTRGLSDDHILYALLVTPDSDYEAARPVFAHMMQSLELGNRGKHP
jgi:Zn-dependent protease with chaperone function